MLRIYKTYDLALHSAVANLSFSARPGDLESKDDFYVMSGGRLVVVETSLNNWNRSNYAYLKPQSVPTWVRVNVASRMASTPEEWASVFQRERSGTHNNQWLAVDMAMKRVVMVEESFYLFKILDVTDLLHRDGYIASFNVAYDQEIYNAAAYSTYGYTYWNDPRSI
jgi:hypothetical protein